MILLEIGKSCFPTRNTERYGNNIYVVLYGYGEVSMDLFSLFFLIVAGLYSLILLVFSLSLQQFSFSCKKSHKIS